MEKLNQKTIVCSILFVDIVGYSKMLVVDQFTLKERFNSYLSEAISDVPVEDRIILDTGDGAAINFMVDVEAALKVALRLHDQIQLETADVVPRLEVRMGINLGSVRLTRDINGQPNIVGDGINVAQRVMGFADVGQIMVSRSYYDAVAMISNYNEMLHYQGRRTDKHVREHEVYAVGGPEMALQPEAPPAPSALSGVMTALNAQAVRLTARVAAWPAEWQALDMRKKQIYGGGAAAVVLLALLPMLLQTGEAPGIAPDASVAGGAAESAVSAQSQPMAAQSEPENTPASAVAASAVPEVVDQKKSEPKKSEPKPAPHPVAKPQPQTRPVAPKPVVPAKPAEEPSKKPAGELQWYEPAVKTSKLVVFCQPGFQVFVDGKMEGKIGSGGDLVVSITDGKHTIIASSPSKGIYTEKIVVDAGKTVVVRPNVCN